MLNRRTLRIKAMQTLYALRQSRMANYGIALEKIRESFLPDLNSMEIQDPVRLKELGEEALERFQAHYLEPGYICAGSSDPRVDEAVNDGIREYHNANQNDEVYFRKTMIQEVDRIYDRYLSMLKLLILFQDLAESDSKRDHSNFIHNPFIQALKTDEELEVLFLRKHISWDNDTATVRQWFKDFLRGNDKYQAYLALDKTDEEKDAEFINQLIKTIIFKNDTIDKFLEERDLNWAEDKAIVKSLTSKTAKSFFEEGKFALQEISYNWEEDKEFFIDLYNSTCIVEKKYEGLIGEKTKNWDIERIALTDRVVIEMAIAEMINFSSIPVKVTINEYIEVVKKYSTPKSKQFINGILDVLSNELVSKGVIKKSGRGLIDNK
ncbi:transcription antitermination factor NusB [Fulvivirga sedimenti]|uniref:Transcription antitermination factor NusB n=1 Tax=Fulvivirga sedimenti TaxID=2879465 RepID=A0A9X1HY94_9BACT|nr:transcription antitermination factor NusB [Fulvivirga sedimenti]MCA6078659.1 transcription antitermination factor NusB [Fulvivirga sedimenti]